MQRQDSSKMRPTKSDIGTIKGLLLTRVDIEEDKDGRSPLILATIQGSVAKVKQLLASEAKDMPDRWGYVALEYAIAYNHSHIVKLLSSEGINRATLVRALEIGFLLRSEDPDGAVIFRFKEIQALETEADMLKYASTYGDQGVIAVLLKSKEISQDDINVALRIAITRYQDEAAVQLLKGGAVDTIDDRSRTTLEMAVDGSMNPAIINLLITGRQGKEERKRLGKALLAAIDRYPSLDALFPFLEAGAINFLDDDDVIRVLIMATSRHDYFVVADACVKRLFPLKTSENKEASKDVYENEKKEIGINQEMKISAGKTVSFDLRDEKGDTLLAHAVHHNNAKVVQLLIEAGVPVDAQNKKDGDTSLILAAGQYCIKPRSRATNVAIVELLLKAGATVDIQNDVGTTALIQAVSASVDNSSAFFKDASSNNAAIVELLLEAGATVSIPNYKGETALKLTESKQDTQIPKMLKKILTPYVTEEEEQFKINKLTYFEFKAWQTPVVRKTLISIAKKEGGLFEGLLSPDIASLVCDYLVRANPDESKAIFLAPASAPSEKYSTTLTLFNKIPLLSFLRYKTEVITQFRSKVCKLTSSTSWWRQWKLKQIESDIKWTKSKEQLNELLLEGANGKYGNDYREIFRELLLIKSGKTNGNNPSTDVPKKTF